MKKSRLNIIKAVLTAICLACASIAGFVASPVDAMAQDTDVITMEFVGFGVVPDFFAIVQGSKLSGKSLVIYRIGGQGPVLVYPLKGTSLAKALTSKEVAPYGIQANAVAGMVAPVGYQLGGVTIGENLQLTLSSGQDSIVLGYAQIFSDPTKTKMAQVMIKNAYWTPDSKKVVIILNQKLGGDWPVDTDMIAAFSLG